MTDLRFLSYEDIRKEELSTRRGYKPRRRSCDAELGLYSYQLTKQQKDGTGNELIADKLRREVNTAMLYRWFKQNMKDVLRT